MTFTEIDHLADHLVLPGLNTVVARDCATTAEMLAYLAVAQQRRLYAPAGYPSMRDYCVGVLSMSEDMAAKRLQAASAVRKCPALLDAVAANRLHLSGACLLAPKLTPENAAELIAAAAGKTKAQIEVLLAERFPQADAPELVMAVQGGPNGHDDVNAPGHFRVTNSQHTEAAPVASLPAPLAKVAPLSPQRFAYQFTANQEAHELCVYAKTLLGNALPNATVEELFLQGMRALVEKLEKKRIGAGSQLRRHRGRTDSRHIPASVRAEVWKRDSGRCTFVGDKGHRCGCQDRIEFDHVEPVARGGASTAANLRLRCRAHNQYEAERAFGKAFMDAKRRAAQARTSNGDVARARARKCAAPESSRPAPSATDAQLAAALEIVPALRHLGFRADEARGAAERCVHLAEAPIGERIRFALKGLAPAGARKVAPIATLPA